MTLLSISGCHSASSSLNTEGEVTDLEGKAGNPYLLKASPTLRSQPDMTETWAVSSYYYLWLLVATGYGAEYWEGQDKSLIKRQPPPKIRSSWGKSLNWALWCLQQTDKEPGRRLGPPLNDRQVPNVAKMGKQNCKLPYSWGWCKENKTQMYAAVSQRDSESSRVS